MIWALPAWSVCGFTGTGELHWAAGGVGRADPASPAAARLDVPLAAALVGPARTRRPGACASRPAFRSPRSRPGSLPRPTRSGSGSGWTGGNRGALADQRAVSRRPRCPGRRRPLPGPGLRQGGPCGSCAPVCGVMARTAIDRVAIAALPVAAADRRGLARARGKVPLSRRGDPSPGGQAGPARRGRPLHGGDAPLAGRVRARAGRAGRSAGTAQAAAGGAARQAAQAGGAGRPVAAGPAASGAGPGIAGLRAWRPPSSQPGLGRRPASSGSPRTLEAGWLAPRGARLHAGRTRPSRQWPGRKRWDVGFRSSRDEFRERPAAVVRRIFREGVARVFRSVFRLP